MSALTGAVESPLGHATRNALQRGRGDAGLRGPINRGVPGAVYAPWDLRTLWQDADGLVPVTGVEQPVSIMLDVSRGLAQGENLMPAPATAVLSAGVTALADGFRFTAAAQNAKADLAPLVPIDDATFYMVYFTIANHSAGLLQIRLFGAAETATVAPLGLGANGTYAIVVDPHGGALATQRIYIEAFGVGANTFDVTDISIRPLPGYHVWTTDPNARPTLSARKNLLESTESFSTASWAKAGSVTVTGNNTINFPVANEAINQTETLGTVPVGLSAAFSIELSGTGTIYIGVARAGTGTYEDTKTKIALTSTPTRYSVSHTILNVGQTGFIPFLSRGTDGTATTVVADKAQLELGPTATRYQRVTTATDYDTAGFPHYLQYNGTSTGLQNIDLSGVTFPFTMVAALQADADTSGGAFSLYQGAPPYYEIQKTATANQWRAWMRNTPANVGNAETVGTNATPHVLAATFTAADVDLVVDGTNATPATAHANPIEAVANIRIGNGGGGWFNGKFFGAAVYFGTPTASELTMAKRALRQRAQLTA